MTLNLAAVDADRARPPLAGAGSPVAAGLPALWRILGWMGLARPAGRVPGGGLPLVTRVGDILLTAPEKAPLDRVAATIAGAFRADFAIICRTDPGAPESLIPAATVGMDDDPPLARAFDRMCGHVVRKRRPVLFGDAPDRADPRFSTQTTEIAAFAGVPLAAHGRLNGVLALGWRSPKQLGGDDAAVLGTLGGQIAAALEAERLREEVHDKEARLRLALDSARLGIWEFDIAGRRRRFDARALEINGADLPVNTWVSTDMPALRAWLETIHPEDRTARASAYERARTGECDVFQADYRVRHKDGRLISIALHGTVTGRDPVTHMATHVAGVMQDATAQRDVEENLERIVAERTAALADTERRLAHSERMRALGQLAGGIAHDFNNVLQAILGASAMIELRPSNAEAVRRFARLATDAAARGQSITRRLLAFARRDDLRAERIAPTALLDGLREILSHTLGASIAVRLELASGLPSMMADRGQLETVLVNLATNARDAMPQGGTLTLAACAETIGSKNQGPLDPGDYIRLTVADTGTGMDRALLTRVTEPFFTTKGIGKGTGLGLSMAKGFAEQSGGAMTIESALGQGTRVILWLPQNAPDEAEQRAASAAREPLRARRADRATRVLLVDDDELVREAIIGELEANEYVVVGASSATEALTLLRAGERADVLVSDFTMPEMDGVNLIKEAQLRCPGLPAILMTGHAGDVAELAVGGVVSGSFSLVRKPVRGAQLRERIADALRGGASGLATQRVRPAI